MFWENFSNLCRIRGIKPNPCAAAIGVSSATVTKWKNGTIPNGETLIKLAEYLDCSVDYLLGRSESQSADITKAPDSEMSEAKRYELFCRFLVAAGYVEEGKDITREQLEALKAVFVLIDRAFD